MNHMFGFLSISLSLHLFLSMPTLAKFLATHTHTQPLVYKWPHSSYQLEMSTANNRPIPPYFLLFNNFFSLPLNKNDHIVGNVSGNIMVYTTIIEGYKRSTLVFIVFIFHKDKIEIQTNSMEVRQQLRRESKTFENKQLSSCVFAI